jgi:phytoene dehydrogenase-like protein
MFPVLFTMGKISKMSCGEYANQFKHPALRKVLNFISSDYSATALVFTLSTLATGDGGYPEGGSLGMTQRMADTFKTLGGKLVLGTKVKKVIVENNIATGVQLEGATLSADAVIITQETIAAIDQLFAAPPKDQWLMKLCGNVKSCVCTFIGVGVRAKITETPTFDLPEPIVCGGISYSTLGFNNYSGYKGYAPEGGTALTTIFMDDTYDFWKKAKEAGRYEAEKQKLADQISRAICAKYPQAVGRIEIIDIATPLTYERYTGAYHGSWMSNMLKGDKQARYPGFLDSVKNVYFAGHRMMTPGGLPVALMSGRQAAQMVCRQFNSVFI